MATNLVRRGSIQILVLPCPLMLTIHGSPHMIPKQMEMDGIVKQIYAALETEKHLQSTLLVLCGDHGMNDAGNHGGSTEGETSPALVFMSPKLQAIANGLECPVVLPETRFDYYTVVEQSDIAPTLAGLLGFPMPLNNLGVFIPKLLGFWEQGLPACGSVLALRKDLLMIASGHRARLMRQNARQIMDIVRGTFPSIDFDASLEASMCTQPQSDTETLRCMWTKANSLSGPDEPDIVGALDALTKVGDVSRFVRDTNILAVLQGRSRDHE